MAQKPSSGSGPAPVFSENEVLCQTPLRESSELLAEMVRLLARRHDAVGDPGAALRAVLEREAAAPTFLAPGIAMPHARLEGLDRTYVAVATSARGVRFPEAEGPVRLVVLVLAPADAPGAYLRVAAAIARRLEDGASLGRICSLSSARAVAAFFGVGGADLHGFVRASDLMVPPPEVLRETDSIKDAIDRIVSTGLSEIPVVDKEGDLVGVASARALLRVCIPDYLLWMEDLSSYANFEPFETLLRKESSTWLADITDDDYASVQADGPAIAVAESMARRSADVCYVLEGARLVGVVTLPRFLHNVFRD